MLREVKPAICARSLIQAHRERIEYFIERTWFSDLSESEEAEASNIFLGIGCALKDAMEKRQRANNASEPNNAPKGGLLDHLSKLGSDGEGSGDD